MISFTNSDGQAQSILFTERQSMPAYVVGLVFAVIIAVTILTSYQSADEIDWLVLFFAGILSLIACIIVLLPKTVTTVDAGGIQLRRRFSFNYIWPYTDINYAEVKPYKEATEEHGSFSLLSSALHVLHETGVLVHLIDGKFTFLSSKQPKDLADAINLGRKKFEQSRYE
ncbi:hypothetical protein PUV54_12740 [Hyphococcus flavus]|uniref:PH domain-containing protein n=1 Tax=Hyphococcus flavus TaxID=1866326 RepID=A0AAF0CE68_9PROT|nr:hypothetical protein [Hyphococcus flavus]WDI30821.1 hypothetical protein PUV54_12740 [Hyphococcus flavus]